MWAADTKETNKNEATKYIKYNLFNLKPNLRKNKHKHYLMSQHCFLFGGSVRRFQEKSLNQRGGNSEGVRKVGSDGNSEYSVCPLLLYPYRQLPVTQLSPCRGEVSAEELMSARWEHLHWAELKWMQRRECVLPLRDTDFQQGNKDCRSRRLKQNMKAMCGQDTWWTQTQEEKLPPPYPSFPPSCCSSPSVAPQRNKTPEEGRKRGKERWCLNCSGSQLNSGPL